MPITRMCSKSNHCTLGMSIKFVEKLYGNQVITQKICMITKSDKRCWDSGDPEGMIGRNWPGEWPDQMVSLQVIENNQK